MENPASAAKRSLALPEDAETDQLPAKKPRCLVDENNVSEEDPSEKDKQ